jgi:lipoyl(octanoyl) transferase
MDWHLMLQPAGCSGAQNMAIDDALMHEADRSGDGFLRLYRFSPACLSFGRNEPARVRYDRAAIERHGFDVVRRPTGGRAVWHEHEVTYAVAAPVAAFGSLRESYQTIHARLAGALNRLGVDATLAPGRDGAVGHGAGAGPCFATPVGGEVLVNGKKVIGSAQVRHGRAFLQHGSILLDGSQDVLSAISYQPSANGSTTLSVILGRSLPFDEVADAIVATWPWAFASAALSRPLPPSAAFTDPAWTWRC